MKIFAKLLLSASLVSAAFGASSAPAVTHVVERSHCSSSKNGSCNGCVTGYGWTTPTGDAKATCNACSAANCATCNGSECVTCRSGYTLIAKACVNTVIANCASHSTIEGKTECATCADGYCLKDGACTKNSEQSKCDSCLGTDSGKCGACSRGNINTNNKDAVTAGQTCVNMMDCASGQYADYKGASNPANTTGFEQECKSCSQDNSGCKECYGVGTGLCMHCSGAGPSQGVCGKASSITNCAYNGTMEAAGEVAKYDYCIQCFDGFIPAADGKSCIEYEEYDDYCQAYKWDINTTSVFCAGCKAGYVRDESKKECVECDSGEDCLVCSTDGKCTLCADGFYIDDGDCEECPEGCLDCTGAEDEKCYRCQPGYILNANKCEECKGNCISCPGGQYNKAGTCTDCDVDDSVCADDSGKFLYCLQGFDRKGTGNDTECEENDARMNCLYLKSDAACAVCNEYSIIDDGECDLINGVFGVSLFAGFAAILALLAF